MNRLAVAVRPAQELAADESESKSKVEKIIKEAEPLRPGEEFDAGRCQLVAHRWIDIGVAAGDAMTVLGRQARDAAHEGSADAEDVQVH